MWQVDVADTPRNRCYDVTETEFLHVAWRKQGRNRCLAEIACGGLCSRFFKEVRFSLFQVQTFLSFAHSSDGAAFPRAETLQDRQEVSARVISSSRVSITQSTPYIFICNTNTYKYVKNYITCGFTHRACVAVGRVWDWTWRAVRAWDWTWRAVRAWDWTWLAVARG